jgi:WD40 repeat protein
MNPANCDEIRKLRKKLRQIDTLELLARDLSEDEQAKVCKKFDIRNRIHQLLAENSGAMTSSIKVSMYTLDSSTSLDTSIELESMTESDLEHMLKVTAEVEKPSSYTGAPVPQMKALGLEDEFDQYYNNSDSESLPDHNSQLANDAIPQITATAPQKKKKPSPKSEKEIPKINNKKVPKIWKSKQFVVKDLRGHSGALVTSVSLSGKLLASGSADTTVKLWDVATGAELRSFGGHLNAVTVVILLDQYDSAKLVSIVADAQEDRDEGNILYNATEKRDNVGHSEALNESQVKMQQVVISASLDCCIKIWMIETGECIKSIYTFNPLTSLAYLPSSFGLENLLVSGSAGGKIEVRNLTESAPVVSMLSHSDAITSIILDCRRVFCASADGFVSMYEMGSDSSLRLVYKSENDANSSLPIHPRAIRCMAFANQNIYWGDDRSNIKALNWTNSTMHKLNNHTTEFGCTDCLNIVNNLLISAGYDIDNGLGYINLRSLPEERYLGSLFDDSTSRILCMTSSAETCGNVVIATGGSQLKVWSHATGRQVTGDGDIFTTEVQYISQFDEPAQHSDNEEVDSDTEELEGNSRHIKGEGLQWNKSLNIAGSDDAANSHSTSWCSVS